MRDIAEVFGVSTVTVSKALGDKEGVSDTLREQIKKKALEMGYFQNAAAKPKGIGVLVAERYFGVNTFYSKFYSEVSISAADSGAFTILEIVSDDDEAGLVLPKLMNMADAIIFLGQFSDKYIDAVSKTGRPFVMLDSYSEERDCTAIVSDNCTDSFRLTEKLIEMGHGSIGFVGSVKETTSIRDRYLGYHRAIAENGLPVRTDWIVSDRKNGRIYQNFHLPKELPEAFVCNCDDTAVRLVNQLKNMGLRIPEDVSVVGYDDSHFAVAGDPKITTCRVDTRKMSENAVTVILSMIDGKTVLPCRIFAKGEIINRESVCDRRDR